MLSTIGTILVTVVAFLVTAFVASVVLFTIMDSVFGLLTIGVIIGFIDGLLTIGVIIGFIGGVLTEKLRNRNTKEGTPSASHNSSSLPRCFYSVGSSCTAKYVQSCNRDFDSCEYRISH